MSPNILRGAFSDLGEGDDDGGYAEGDGYGFGGYGDGFGYGDGDYGYGYSSGAGDGVGYSEDEVTT